MEEEYGAHTSNGT
jgi:hypothetical protein